MNNLTKIIFIAGIFFIFTISFFNSLYGESDETKNYRAWKSSLNKKGTKSAYFMPNNTILCLTRDDFVRAYNDLVVSGQPYYKYQLEQYNCRASYGWSVARIVKKTRSGIIQIQYWEGAGGFANRRWTHEKFLTQWDEYRKWLKSQVAK